MQGLFKGLSDSAKGLQMEQEMMMSAISLVGLGNENVPGRYPQKFTVMRVNLYRRK